MGIGQTLQGRAEPVELKKANRTYGLGYSPTREEKEKMEEMRRKRRLAKLERREHLLPGLGKVPHISVTFTELH